MLVKTGTPAVFYNWYHHPNGAEVSGLLITARFEKALSAVPPITGSNPKLRKNADRLEEDATFSSALCSLVNQKLHIKPSLKNFAHSVRALSLE